MRELCGIKSNIIGVFNMIIKSKKGMTLLEVIVAIAILGIIAVSLLGAFLQGFSTIFSMGNKTRAISTAQELVDMACDSGNTIELGTISTEAIDDTSFYRYDEGTKHKFRVSTQTKNETTYERVTVIVFYQHGKRYVTLTSLIP